MVAVTPPLGNHHANAIVADEADSVFAANAAQLVAQRLLVVFFSVAGDADGELDALLPASAERVGKLREGQEDHGDVDVRRQVSDVRDTFDPIERNKPRIHGVDLAAKAVSAEVPQRAAGQFAFVCGRANYRDGTRRQKSVYIALSHRHEYSGDLRIFATLFMFFV